MKIIYLLFLMILTSCASTSNNYKYTKYHYQELKNEGKIAVVPSYMACHDNEDLQKESVYVNFYGLTDDKVIRFTSHIPDFSMELSGVYNYTKVVKNNDQIFSTEYADSKAHIFNWKIAVCDSAYLYRKIKERNYAASKKIFLPSRKIITLKIVPNRVIEDFMKGKYSTKILENELSQVNKKFKNFKGKGNLICINDKCFLKKNKTLNTSYKINIEKVYTPEYTGGFFLNLNYAYILDSIKYIRALPRNNFIRRLYL